MGVGRAPRLGPSGRPVAALGAPGPAVLQAYDGGPAGDEVLEVAARGDAGDADEVRTLRRGELAGAAQIMSIPTLMAFRDGILVYSQAGALPAEALEQVIDAVRGLDMDDVRRKVAEQNTAD